MARTKEGAEVELACDPAAPAAAYVFRTVADPFVGKLSYVKVFSGTLKADTALVNARTGETERFGKLLALRGKRQTDAGSIGAGDIGAVTSCPPPRPAIPCATRPGGCAAGRRVPEPHPGHGAAGGEKRETRARSARRWPA